VGRARTSLVGYNAQQVFLLTRRSLHDPAPAPPVAGFRVSGSVSSELVINKLYEDEDGNTVHLLDVEGIDYLIEGLTELRDSEPGERLSTPSVTTDHETGELESVGKMILERAADVDTPR
jgi:hypothetical protein